MRRSDMRKQAAGRRSQGGMTLIELMIAMAVLAIGMAGVMILITTGIATNSRNKGDTTGTMVAQMVLDKIATYPANAAGIIQVTDCRPANLGGPQLLNISTAAAALPVGAGAQLDPAGSGTINWAQAQANVPVNYGMTYYVCGAQGTSAPYDVRWNIAQMTVIGGTTYNKLIVVSARPLGVLGGAAQGVYYQPPVTLRTITSM